MVVHGDKHRKENMISANLILSLLDEEQCSRLALSLEEHHQIKQDGCSSFYLSIHGYVCYHPLNSPTCTILINTAEYATNEVNSKRYRQGLINQPCHSINTNQTQR